MEKSKKSRNDHGENKKMLIKIGAGAGGGVGAVVLLGGALVTAALASFFAVRLKSRSSQNSSSEINHKSEKDDSDIREGKEDDSTIKIYAQSLNLDDKAMVQTDAALSDDGFVIIKKEIPFLAEDQRPEDENDTKEDVSEEYSHDKTEAEADTKVDMDKKEVEGFCNGYEEINAPEKSKVDLGGDAMGDIQGAIAIAERRSEDGEKPVLPLFEGHDIQQDDYVEMLGVDEAIVGSEKDEVEYIEEKTVEEECCVSIPKQDLPVDDLAGVSREVCENSISMQLDAKKNVEKEMEIARDGATATGETPQKELGEEELRSLSNEMRSSKSNWEALWQAESPEQVKLIKYEVGGKMQEDESSANDYPTNAMRWRMIMWTVCVLSSLSCSCFFNLSFAKLCLLVFLTAFLLEIYGFSLLNRHHAQCSLAAEQGDKKPSNKLANL